MHMHESLALAPCTASRNHLPIFKWWSRATLTLLLHTCFNFFSLVSSLLLLFNRNSKHFKMDCNRTTKQSTFKSNRTNFCETNEIIRNIFFVLFICSQNDLNWSTIFFFALKKIYMQKIQFIVMMIHNLNLNFNLIFTWFDEETRCKRNERKISRNHNKNREIDTWKFHSFIWIGLKIYCYDRF